MAAQEDEPGLLSFSAVTSSEASAQAWGEIVMGLARRASEQHEEDVPSASPFRLHVECFAQGRFVTLDWSGVRVARMSRRYRMLEVQVALEESLPADPLAAVLGAVDEAVELACAYARQKKIADDLPAIRAEAARLRAAGPAPIRVPPPLIAVWADDDPGDGSFLSVVTSSGEVDVDPSEGMLEALLDDLLSGDEDSLLLSRRTEDSGATLRVTREGDQVRLERQDLSAEAVYVSHSADEDLVRDALIAWAYEREQLPSELAWHPMRF